MNDLLTPSGIVIVVAIIILFAIRTSRSKAPVKEGEYTYAAKQQVMTSTEKKFYDQLLTRLGDRHYIVPQAHLSMFIDHKIVGQNWRGAFSRINGKSVDFLIVEKATQKPVAAIELDDYTHKRDDRVERDGFVERVLEATGIPLTRCATIGQIPTLDAILATKGTSTSEQISDIPSQ